MISNIIGKLYNNRYIREEVIEKTSGMEPGIKRRLFRIGGCVVELIKHRFNLWDYRHKVKWQKRMTLCVETSV